MSNRTKFLQSNAYQNCFLKTHWRYWHRRAQSNLLEFYECIDVLRSLEYLKRSLVKTNKF